MFRVGARVSGFEQQFEEMIVLSLKCSFISYSAPPATQWLVFGTPFFFVNPPKISSYLVHHSGHFSTVINFLF